MAIIENPILRGFNPDPSIVRVGADYYIATSTFEWFPGVQLHHSRDLVHWRLVGHALTRKSQLDLSGVLDSGGVWAPSLSHADGQFWLIYTNVRTHGSGRPFKDLGIFLVTAPTIDGPWSEPVALNAIGFDPSLFHDDDGRKWLVNMMWDFRQTGLGRFAGIVIQEYSSPTRRLVGPMTKIFQKPGALLEGPNLYKRAGRYYLMMAEGGTGWNHGIAMARSQNLLGPYELDPLPLLTTRDDPSCLLQKAGHGEVVETPGGEWYLAHLAGRPIGTGEHRRCMLGRETCLQKVVWSEDGWLRLATGGWHPQIRVPGPSNARAHPWPAASVKRDDFDALQLQSAWSSLRVPIEESWLSLSERPGWLRLRGRESLHSLFQQSLVAQRLQITRCIVQTSLEFAPGHFTQTAGLICYYDTRTHFYLRVTHHEQMGRVLGIVVTDDTNYRELTDAQVSVNDWPCYYLCATIEGAALQFSASRDGQNWEDLGPVLDASKLSDDYGQALHFTGAFVGLCAQDVGGTRAIADFDFFDLRYSETRDQSDERAPAISDPPAP
jgi:xylan 1,4-beta-xylosidase